MRQAADVPNRTSLRSACPCARRCGTALELLGRNNQREPVRDEERRYHFQGRTCRREVADGAVDAAPAERDRPGLQNPASWCASVVVCHHASQLDPTPRFRLASRTAVENFAQSILSRTLCRKARHFHQTVRARHNPDRPADWIIAIVTRLDTFCQWHSVTPRL